MKYGLIKWLCSALKITIQFTLKPRKDITIKTTSITKIAYAPVHVFPLYWQHSIKNINIQNTQNKKRIYKEGIDLIPSYNN